MVKNMKIGPLLRVDHKKIKVAFTW